MREYTTIPNVFRVASLQSANNQLHHGNSTNLNNQSNNANSDNNQANDTNLQQQQQQHILSSSTTTSTTTTTTTQAIVHTGMINDGGAIGAESVAIRVNYPHKLTTIAAIERQQQYQQHPHMHALPHSHSHTIQHSNPHTNPHSHPNEGIIVVEASNRRGLQSPYATLPRGLNGDMHAKPNTSRQQHEEQRIINTISGSIPSTGFTNAITTLERSGSLASDLNISLTDFSQLNSLDIQDPLNEHHPQHPQQQQQHQQQKFYHHDDYPHFQTSRRLSQKPFMELERKNDNGYLWILTPVAASISVAIVIAALAGPQWLFTEEKLPNANYNGTANYNLLDDGVYLTKYTKSSLWILCTTMQGVETYNCIKIDYFPKEGYQPEAHDSTPAIPYTVRKSAPLFLASGVFLLISFIVYLIPTCSHQNSLYYFSAGVMFIVTGLFMLIGLITYISMLKAEIGSKLRPRSALQPALLKVTYGQSFFLYVFGFIATEFVGVLNIFLYISLQEIGYYSRLPCFTLANLREKIKEGQHPRKRQYQLQSNQARHTQTSSGSMGGDQKPLPRRQRQVHNTHTTKATTTSNTAHSTLDSDWHETKKLLQIQQLSGSSSSSALGCRRHPNGPESNMRYNNDLERRFYFEKSTANKCNLHSKNLAKSLSELSVETASSPAHIAANMPKASLVTRTATNQNANSTITSADVQHFHHQQQQQQQQHKFSNLPQEFPLTRSISTTTELFAANGSYGNGNGNGNGNSNYRAAANKCVSSSGVSLLTRHHLSSIDTDNDDQNVVVGEDQDHYDVDTKEPQQRLCGLKRSSIRRTKDDLFQEFCKRAGARPKPKTIYYVASEEEQHQQQQHQQQQQQQAAAAARAMRRQHQLSTETETLREVDEQLYNASEDNQPNHELNLFNATARRASMFVEPLHIRQLGNSNLSLHNSALYAPELERPLGARGPYGGSQTQLNQFVQQQSRTLPRSFLKQRTGTDSQESVFGSSSLHASNLNLHNQLHIQQQQQQPIIARLQTASNQLMQPAHVLTLHKSCDKLNLQYPMSQQKQLNAPQVTVQWPAAIPSSPANFSNSKFQIYTPTSASTSASATASAASVHKHLAHNFVTRSASTATPKFQRAYAFDDQRRLTALHNDTFDLDEMERERRRSHANLLGVGQEVEMEEEHGKANVNGMEQYDLINGTAV